MEGYARRPLRRSRVDIVIGNLYIDGRSYMKWRVLDIYTSSYGGHTAVKLLREGDPAARPMETGLEHFLSWDLVLVKED